MTGFAPPHLYGVIGYPLGHSLSPLLHTTAFRTLGIPGVFLPWPMPAGKLPAFIEAMRLLDIRGAAVTIPHKRAIMPLLDGLSDRARTAGAVNLVHRDGDRLLGDNTDVPGFVAPLPPLPPATRVLLLGSGGAARAAAAGLRTLGAADIRVAGRNGETAAGLAREFGLTAIDWNRRGETGADLIVNTTPLGMKGEYEGETPCPGDLLAKTQGIAYDVVYSPARTRFLREAEAAGWRTVNGLDMFLGQADLQFLAWTGQRLPEEAKRAVLDASQGAAFP